MAWGLFKGSRGAVAVLALLISATSAPAEYPDRPIKFILPFLPGGAVDVVTRLVADRMATELGRAIVLEPKPGAGGILATDAVAKADKDGYTLLITTPNHTINAALNPKLPYDTEKDL
ncbi:MAG: tripartite tricarboxylate transporter substrate-binding protein, partial [Xanthobacteraceae bacterium]